MYNPSVDRPGYVTDQAIIEFIDRSLLEDIGPGDYSSLAAVPADSIKRARLLCKSQGVAAGIEIAEKIFCQFDERLRFTKSFEDGTTYEYGDDLFTVEGPTRSILSCERLVLNCIQRMSGIATHANRLVNMTTGTHARLLDTRKTTPCFRLCEKWAVVIGGGLNHRFGLFDAIMLKDNHIDYNGGIGNAIMNTRNYLQVNKLDLDIIVEVRNHKELTELLIYDGVKRVLLDNMNSEEVSACVQIVNGKIETEASGGINESNLKAYALTGVDYISMGSLIYDAPILDFSLKAY